MRKNRRNRKKLARKPKGWRNEPGRHSLAAQGVETTIDKEDFKYWDKPMHFYKDKEGKKMRLTEKYGLEWNHILQAHDESFHIGTVYDLDKQEVEGVAMVYYEPAGDVRVMVAESDYKATHAKRMPTTGKAVVATENGDVGNDTRNFKTVHPYTKENFIDTILKDLKEMEE